MKSGKRKTVKRSTKRSPARRRRRAPKESGRRTLQHRAGHDITLPPGHPGAHHVFPLPRAITANDFTIDTDEPNYTDTLVVVVNFSWGDGSLFLLSDERWNRIFGLTDPLTQLNSFFHANYYGQIELKPVELPPELRWIGDKYPHVEIELQDTYALGFAIYPPDYQPGPDDELPVNPDEERRFVLDIMAKVVERYPTLDFQDKLILAVINADGEQYGRGAMCAVPTGDFFDLFVGDIRSEEDLQRYSSDSSCFRTIDDRKVVAVITKGEGYTFDDYFQDRGNLGIGDQFIRGMVMFEKTAQLSCASHDITHAIRRKSAYADPPEGRNKAVNCLYNLPLQTEWFKNSCDRSVNCSPYVGWWDSMADHLHSRDEISGRSRDFFESPPQGTCAYTKIKLGMIPERCVCIVTGNNETRKLVPLSNPTLPPRDSDDQYVVLKIPVDPSTSDAYWQKVYLLLEYRRRIGQPNTSPENFTIQPDQVYGDKRTDPGYNQRSPQYQNPPTAFVPSQGVLVYLVNENLTDNPSQEYIPAEWHNFRLILLNPNDIDDRDNLNSAALGSGSSVTIDFHDFYDTPTTPIAITVEVTGDFTEERAEIQITRTYSR